MARHPLYVSRSVFGGVKRRSGSGQVRRRSAALKAASKLVTKSRAPAVTSFKARLIRKQPSLITSSAAAILGPDASDKKKAMLAAAIREATATVRDAVAMETGSTGSRRSSVSSVESASSVSSAGSSSSSRSSGSTGSVSRVTRAANGVVKTRLRPKRLAPTTKAAPPKPASVKASRTSPVPRCKREDVADQLVLTDLKWSTWKPAIVPTTVAPEIKDGGEWVERRGERPGLRNIELFSGKSHNPAVYEFAVQAPGSEDLHPVLSRATAGYTGSHWDAKFLSTLSVEAQVDRVLKRGCKIFARRAPYARPISAKKDQPSSLGELRSLIHKTYDYAWQEHYDVDARKYFHRNVRRNGVAISDNPKEWM